MGYLRQACAIHVYYIELNRARHIVRERDLLPVRRVIGKPAVWGQFSCRQIRYLEQIAAIGINCVNLPRSAEVPDKSNPSVLSGICRPCLTMEKQEDRNPKSSELQSDNGSKPRHKSSLTFVPLSYSGATPHRGITPPSSISFSRPRRLRLPGGVFFARGSTASGFNPPPSTFIT